MMLYTEMLVRDTEPEMLRENECGIELLLQEVAKD